MADKYPTDGLIEAAAALAKLQAENSELRLAICGGEDAPGYADSLPHEAILGVVAQRAVPRSRIGGARVRRKRTQRIDDPLRRDPAVGRETGPPCVRHWSDRCHQAGHS